MPRPVKPYSKAEGDAIARDVLRLVQAVLADTQGQQRDRVMRSPEHDLIFYGTTYPVPVVDAPHSGKGRTPHGPEET